MQLPLVISSFIGPALTHLDLDSPEARVLLVAIGLQESDFTYLKQINGPARGYWQMEPNGVRAVLTHPVVGRKAMEFCYDMGILPTTDAVARSLEVDSVLACGMARLLLFADRFPLPAVDDSLSGWAYYLRNWRPGKPRPSDWTANHAAAVAAVMPSQPAVSGVPAP